MKKIMLLIIALLTCCLSGCKPKITKELLGEAIDKQTLRSYYMESKFGVSLDYALLPYYLVMEESSDYNIFSNQGKTDNSIKIEWEIMSDNLQLETLTSKTIKEKGYNCKEILSTYVYAKLSYYNDEDEVLAVKIDYFKNMPTAKLKATFTCQDVVFEKEYEIINLISAGNKYMENKGYSGSDDVFSKSYQGSGTVLGNDYSWEEKCKINAIRNEMTYEYKNGRSIYYLRYDMVEGNLYYGATSSTTDYISIYDGSLKVPSYQQDRYLIGVREIINMIKTYDTFLSYEGKLDMVSPFYENQNYPTAEDIVK